MGLAEISHASYPFQVEFFWKISVKNVLAFFKNELSEKYVALLTLNSINLTSEFL